MALYAILTVANILGIIKPEDMINASGLKLSCCMLMGVSGAIMILLISQKADKKIHEFSILKFIGKNSLYFYILHFVGIYYLQNSDMNFINSIIAIVLCIMCPLVAILLLKKTKLNNILFIPRFKLGE